ncbi:MAG TPA: DUF1707 domain-containing protein [Streptosporangiaceae bacterium]
MATGPNIRVGDAERESVAAQLREHYGDGRLTLDELNERLDRTFAARTYGELNTVTTDLPRNGDMWTPSTGSGAVGTSPSRLTVGPQGTGSGAHDDGWNGAPGRAAAMAAPLIAIMTIAGLWVLLMFGGIFGGGGRPFGFVLLFAIFALIRRVLGGGRGGRGGRCGRRW